MEIKEEKGNGDDGYGGHRREGGRGRKGRIG